MIHPQLSFILIDSLTGNNVIPPLFILTDLLPDFILIDSLMAIKVIYQYPYLF